MLNIDITDGNGKKVINFGFISKVFNNWPKQLKADIVDELTIGVVLIRNRILLSMRNTKRASWFYMRSGQRHYPSAPGSPPAIDRGELIRAITMDADINSVEVGATAGAPYAQNLEDGTKKMKARPWLQPAVDAELTGVVERVIKRINKSI